MKLILHTHRIKQAHKVSVIYKMQYSEDHAEPFLQKGVKHPQSGCKNNNRTHKVIKTKDTLEY